MSRAESKTARDARQLTYLAAIHEAQQEELRRDERVILLGQDTEANLFGAAEGLVEEFGRGRVRDTPISELGFTGAAIGAAMTGLRPIVDFTVATFMLVAMEQLVSQAAKARYMFGGQATIPVVFRATTSRCRAPCMRSGRPGPRLRFRSTSSATSAEAGCFWPSPLPQPCSSGSDRAAVRRSTWQ